MEDGGRFERQLEDVLAGSRWRVGSASRGDAGFDLLASDGQPPYVVEIKYATEARRALLEGMLASAILRTRSAARGSHAKPLAIVCAPSISDPLLNELGEFVRRFGEGSAWGAMDDSGLVVLHGTGLEGIRRQRHHTRKASPVPQRSNVLSDLGQWMLKVLVSHALPPELRLLTHVDHAQIDEPVSNAMALARIAGVSVASAARLVASLREERFLVDDSGLRLVRVDELLAQWRAVFARRSREARARWLFTPKDAPTHLDDLLRDHAQRPGERACLGLFAACDRLGFRFVRGVAPHLYVEKLSIAALQQLGLRLAEPGESADVLVREPRFPESVFRGTLRRDGVPVADVLQTWLDVSEHPARGDEMAAHLLDRVIRPSLLERAP